MLRIAKKREERKQELVDTAMRLFLTKGYEHTAVSDIVKEVNVAQGTFYYYFKSKTDILEAVVIKLITDVIDNIHNIANNSDTDAAERLNEIVNRFSNFHNVNEEIFDYLHQESNFALHAKLGKITFVKLTPILTGLIAEGAANGRFKVAYPAETAEFVILVIGQVLHLPSIMSDNERRKRVRITFEEILNRILKVTDFAFKLNL